MIKKQPISDLKKYFANIEGALHSADFDAKNNPTRYTHEEVFNSLQNNIKKKYNIK